MKKILIILFLFSCSPKSNYVELKITYLDGTKEKLKTIKYWACGNVLMLKANCTECIVDSRCGVKSVKKL